MGDWREQVRRGLNLRTYLLLAILVGTIVWVQSLDGRARAMRARSAAVASAPADPIPSPVVTTGSGGAEPAEQQSWGRDPFDPKFSGARN
jgi:hypothetical protein